MKKNLLVIKKIFIVVLTVFMVLMGCPEVKANQIYSEMIINDSDVGEDVNQFWFSDGWVAIPAYLKVVMNIGQLKRFSMRIIHHIR